MENQSQVRGLPQQAVMGECMRSLSGCCLGHILSSLVTGKITMENNCKGDIKKNS